MARPTGIDLRESGVAKCEKVIDGVEHVRVFAFRHKHRGELFGALGADDYETARDILGKPYYIRSAWVAKGDLGNLLDRDFARKIVDNSIKVGEGNSKGSGK